MKYFNKKEKYLLVTISLLIGYIIIGNDERTSSYFIHSIVLFGSSLFLFLIHAIFFYPILIKQDKIRRYAVALLTIIFVLYSINTYLYTNYIKELLALKQVYKDISLFNSMKDRNTLIYIFLLHLILFSILGIIYSIFSNLLIKRRFKLIKTICIYFSLFMILAVIVFSIKYYIDIAWKGNNDIRFIDHNTESLEQLLELPQFKGKIVYLDLWFSSCGPCIAQFKKLPEVKKSLENSEVVFLYLARQTSHPNHRQLWKNAIKKYNLKGWHVYMNVQLEANIWEEIGKYSNKVWSYPHYLLIDKNNVIVSFNAPRPSEKEKLLLELAKFID